MLLFIIRLLQFLSVVNLFALNHSCGRLQAIPVTTAASMVFLLFFFTLLFQGYNLHARHLYCFLEITVIYKSALLFTL